MSTINSMILTTMLGTTVAACLYAANLAKKADRYEARLRQMDHSYWNAYCDRVEGKPAGETLDKLMENINIVLKH